MFTNSRSIKDNRRYSILLCLLLILSVHAHAQVNYVLNPSFEQHWRCPYENDQIKFANYWSPIDSSTAPPIDSFGNPNCTPNYCNECAGTNHIIGVPKSDKFYHYPRTGAGMVEVVMFDDGTNGNPETRDYLQGQLVQPLIQGQSYCVTFFVTLEQAYGYAVNHIGAYLDNGILDTTQNCGQPQTTHIPQIQTLNVINDTLDWVKIEGSFIADGNEKFITIGNFYDKAHTTYVVSNSASLAPSVSVYLVDDVSVVESELPAYAGGRFFKPKNDSVFIGRNEIVPDCMWYRNGVLIDTLHAGFWVKDTTNTTYVVKQSICGNVKYDTAKVIIVPVGVNSVGNESIYRVYPNPATTEITIQAPNSTSSASMAIYDMGGKTMLRNEIHFANGETHVPLQVPKGIYVIELIDETGNKNIQRLSVL